MTATPNSTMLGSAADSPFEVDVRLRQKIEDLAASHRTTGTVPYSCYSDAPAPEDAMALDEAAPAAGAGKLSGSRVLVVEDDYVTAVDIKRLLTREGARVSLTGRVDDALRRIESETFNLVLIDRLVYGGSSESIADQLLRRGCAFAFVSGYGAGDMPDRFHDVPYLQKPVDGDHLVRLVGLL